MVEIVLRRFLNFDFLILTIHCNFSLHFQYYMYLLLEKDLVLHLKRNESSNLACFVPYLMEIVKVALEKKIFNFVILVFLLFFITSPSKKGHDPLFE